jgi:hypothetical protein
MGEADIAKLIEEMSNSFSEELKHADSNITVALELLVRQSRWHRETDDAAELNATRLGKLEADVLAIEHKLGIQA